VGFSKSSDPNDGFNIYVLDGNPLNDSTWSDYPHISVNEQDLFITMNKFTNGSFNNNGYVQSTIRQVGKQAGYDSLPLTEHYYHDLKSGNRNLFNFTGMKGGLGLQRDTAYFISTRNLDLANDSIYLARITGPASGSPSLSLETYRAENQYGLPPEARQSGNHRFDCNDARVQGGFIHQNKIQFVGNTITPQNNSGFYHGMIDLNSAQRNNIYFKIIGFDPVDVGYPQISYTGKSATEIESIISFNHSGDTLNAGFSAIFFDNDSSYSDRRQIIEGGDRIDIISDRNGDQFYERWGDYTGSQPMYGDTGVVWAAGYEASDRGQPLTAMVKLRSPNWNSNPISGLELADNDLPKSRTYPNPAPDWFEMELVVPDDKKLFFELRSLNGQLIFKIEEQAYEGQNLFRFRTAHLASGSYLLSVTGEQGQLVGKETIIKP
jgi:hypothetical protein